MKRHIVCLGDSNTHGYCADPSDCADGKLLRYNEQERWTCLLQSALGDEYLVVEEGLSGRTTVFNDPLFEGLSALDYVYPCLKSHEPVSLLVIMLGTNDTKERFHANAAIIGLGMQRLIRKARAIDCWEPGGTPNILVMAPPAIGEGIRRCEAGVTMGYACAEISRQVAHHLKLAAEATDAHYLDTTQVGAEFNTVDYMHLTKRAHARLADALSTLIPSLI